MIRLVVEIEDGGLAAPGTVAEAVRMVLLRNFPSDVKVQVGMAPPPPFPPARDHRLKAEDYLARIDQVLTDVRSSGAHVPLDALTGAALAHALLARGGS